MGAFDSVLKLRPTNAAARLGTGCRVCVLNARDVQRSLEEGSSPLVVFDVGLPGLIATLASAVLRAAKHLDAPVGLAVPMCERGQGPAPQVAFRDLAQAGEEAQFRLPTSFCAGPLTVSSAERADVARARELVFRYIDAGFTQIAVRGTGLPPELVADVLSEIAAPASERELGLEVLVDGSEPGALESLVKALRASSVPADVFTVAGEAEVDGARAAELVAPSTLGLEDPSPAALKARTARRVRFTRCFPALVRALSLASAGTLDEAGRIKIEAYAYHEALERLQAAGARASGQASLKFLAERNGY